MSDERARAMTAEIIAMRVTTSFLLAAVAKIQPAGAMETLRVYRSEIDDILYDPDDDMISRAREAIDLIFSDAMGIASKFG